MALVLNTSNGADTAVAGLVLPKNFSVRPLNYTADWALSNSEPSKKTYITRNAAFTGYEDKIILAVTPIADIYKGLSIATAYRAESSRGVSTLLQLNGWWAKTDVAVPGYLKLLPHSEHLVIKTPLDTAITEAHVFAQVRNACALAFGPDNATSTATTIFSWIKSGVVGY